MNSIITLNLIAMWTNQSFRLIGDCIIISVSRLHHWRKIYLKLILKFQTAKIHRVSLCNQTQFEIATDYL